MEKENSKKTYKAYEIKVCIRDMHPPVWRRLQIPGEITFHELSAIIQLAFGWCGYHLYSFEVNSKYEVGGTYIELPAPDSGFCDFEESLNAKKVKIDKYFKENNRLKYVYDFGDNWVHDIIVEKVIKLPKKLEKPVCIKAKMADLPEDCGGPWGYEDLLEILSDKENEEYEVMKEWVENACCWEEDRSKVDIERINARLEDYKGHARLILHN